MHKLIPPQSQCISICACLIFILSFSGLKAQNLSDQFDSFVEGATWSVYDQGAVLSNNGVLSLNGSYIVAGDGAWDNYVMEFGARAPQSASEVRIVSSVRWQNDRTRYVLSMRGGNSNDLHLARIGSGNQNAILKIVPLDFIPQKGTWYKFRVEVTNDTTFRVFLNDEDRPRLEVNDSSNPIGNGKIALGGGWSKTEFDWVTVSAFNPYSPSSSAQNYNFQPPGSTPVSGWEVVTDSGYDPVVGWGWIDDDSVATRERGKSDDKLFDTLVMVNDPDGPYPALRTFQLDLANGDYVVTVQMGDAKYTGFNKLYFMDDAGPTIDTLTTGGSSVIARKSISVTEGKLTLTIEMGSGINWMVVDPRSEAGEDAWAQNDFVPHDDAPEREARRLAQRTAYQKFIVSDLSETRQEYSLNGEWLFMPEQGVSGGNAWDVNLDDSAWHIMDVPNMWNPLYNWGYKGKESGRGSTNWKEIEEARCENYTFDYLSTGSGFYRHCLSFPSGISDKIVKIKFGAIASFSRVWVNGTLAAVHQGMFAPVDVDISDYVQEGDNYIVVQAAEYLDLSLTDPSVQGADKITNLTTEMLGDLPKGIFEDSNKGIWQDVVLTITDKVKIVDAFFKPETDDYEVAVKIKNFGNTSETYHLASQIRDINDNSLIYDHFEGSRRVGISTNSGSTSERTARCEDDKHPVFAMWSPEFPDLYKHDLFLYKYNSDNVVALDSFNGSAIKLNFQRLSDSTVSGWTAVDGSLYTGSGYGWSHNMSGRDRNDADNTNQLGNTLLRPPAGVESVFTYDLQNGDYVISVQFGDPSYPSLAEAHIGNGVNDIESTIVRDFNTAGDAVIALKSVTISNGKLEITVPSLPNEGETTAINWLVIEERQDVSQEKWNLGLNHFDILDNVSFNVGFRTFVAAGDDFLLNGIPYKIRGGNHSPNIIRPNDAALADKFIKTVSDHNINFTRSHGSPYNGVWFDACDRHGLAVSQEGIWPWLFNNTGMPPQELIDVWMNEWLLLIDEYKNHPSLLMYTMNNEMKLYNNDLIAEWVVLSDVIGQVRALDPTRVVVADSGYARDKLDGNAVEYSDLVSAGLEDGDVDDVHMYPNWYNPDNGFFNLRSASGSEFLKFHTPGRPFISQEFSFGYLDSDTGHAHRQYVYDHYNPFALIGKWSFEHMDPSYFMKRHAMIGKELGEAIRTGYRDTSAGVMLFSMVSWFQNMYDADRIQAWPTLDAVSKAWEPILVSAQLMGRQFYAGTSHTVNIVLVNDSPIQETLDGISVDWEVVHNGTTLSSGTKSFSGTLSYYNNKQETFTFSLPSSLPEEKIDASLVLKLKANGRDISQNDYDITIASDSYVQLSPGLRVGHYTQSDQLTSILENKLGVTVVPVSDLNSLNLNDYDVLIVANLSSMPADYSKVVNFANAGGKVLLYRNKSYLDELLPDEFRSSTSRPQEIATPYEYRSPVFYEIEPDELSWFTGTENESKSPNQGLIPFACTRAYHVRNTPNQKLLAEATAIHGYYSESSGTYNNAGNGSFDDIHGFPMVEVSKGSGTLIASSIFMETEEDPIANKLLANTIAYLGGVVMEQETIPVVSFITPDSDIVVTAGTSLDVDVSAADPDEIDRVRLYIDGVELGRSEGSAPYRWSGNAADAELSNLQPGTFVLTAIATDMVGDAGQASVTVTVNEIVDTGNLIVNGSFESGESGWSVGGNSIVSSENSHAGTYSLKLTDNPSNTRQTVAIEPNTNYRLSLWVYAAGLTGNNIHFDTLDKFDAGTGPGQECQFNIDIGDADVWTYYEGSFYSGSETSVTIRTYGSDMLGLVYFDNIRLEKISVTDPYNSWKIANNISEDFADDDNDGISNIMEFAIGGDPKSAGGDQRPVVSETSSEFEFRFQRNEASINYSVEKSTDLINWSNHATVSDAHGAVGAEAVVPIPKAEMAAGKLFLRLKVER